MPLDSRSSRCQIFTFHNNADSEHGGWLLQQQLACSRLETGTAQQRSLFITRAGGGRHIAEGRFRRWSRWLAAADGLARTVLPPPSSRWWWPPRLGLPGDVISAGFRKGVGGVRKDWWRWQVAGCRLSPPRVSRNTGFWCYPICTNLWSESSTRFRAPISFSSSTAHLHLLFWLSLHNNTVQSTVYEP